MVTLTASAPEFVEWLSAISNVTPTTPAAPLSTLMTGFSSGSTTENVFDRANVDVMAGLNAVIDRSIAAPVHQIETQ